MNYHYTYNFPTHWMVRCTGIYFRKRLSAQCCKLPLSLPIIPRYGDKLEIGDRWSTMIPTRPYRKSSSATHPLMLVIICAKYGKHLSRTVGVTERTRYAGRTDGQTERQTIRVKPIYTLSLRPIPRDGENLAPGYRRYCLSYIRQFI